MATLDPATPKLLVLGGESPEALIVATRAALERLGHKETDAEAEFGALLLATVAAEKAAAAPRFALCLVCSAATLKKELELAANGVATAAATGRPYASVAGSCFSPKPTRSKQVAMTAAPAAPTLRTLLATATHAHARARARARALLTQLATSPHRWPSCTAMALARTVGWGATCTASRRRCTSSCSARPRPCGAPSTTRGTRAACCRRPWRPTARPSRSAPSTCSARRCTTPCASRTWRAS